MMKPRIRGMIKRLTFALMRLCLSIHRCTPLGTILRATPSCNLEVQLLQCATDWANLPISDGAMIDADDGGNLCACATEEDFFSDIEFCAVYLAFASDAAQLAACQLNDGVTGDAEEDVLCGGGCD